MDQTVALQLMAALATATPTQHIVDEIAKNASILSRLMREKKVGERFNDLKDVKQFNELMQNCQLFSIKMAYDGKDLVDIMKNVQKHSDSIKMDEEIDKLFKK